MAERDRTREAGPPDDEVAPGAELLLAQALEAALAAQARGAPAPRASREIQAEAERLAQLAAALQASAAEAAPSAAFRAAGRARLMRAIAAEEPPRASTATEPIPLHRSRRLGGAGGSVGQWLLRAAAGLVAASVAGFATLNASASALPGDPLYAVKQATETLSLQLAAGDEARVLALLRQADARLDETARLVRQGRTTDAVQVAQRYDDAVDRATAALVSSATAPGQSGETRTAMVERFEKKLEEHQERLAVVRGSAPDAAEVGLAEAAEAPRRGLARAAEVEQSSRESKRGDPATPAGGDDTRRSGSGRDDDDDRQERQGDDRSAAATATATATVEAGTGGSDAGAGRATSTARALAPSSREATGEEDARGRERDAGRQAERASEQLEQDEQVRAEERQTDESEPRSEPDEDARDGSRDRRPETRQIEVRPTPVSVRAGPTAAEPAGDEDRRGEEAPEVQPRGADEPKEAPERDEPRDEEPERGRSGGDGRVEASAGPGQAEPALRPLAVTPAVPAERTDGAREQDEGTSRVPEDGDGDRDRGASREATRTGTPRPTATVQVDERASERDREREQVRERDRERERERKPTPDGEKDDGD